MLLIGFVPRFDEIFRRLAERDGLPWVSEWLVGFVRMDAAGFHIPVVLVALAMIGLDVAVVRCLRKRSGGNFWSWLWVVAAGAAGLSALVLIIVALLHPVLQSSSIVHLFLLSESFADC